MSQSVSNFECYEITGQKALVQDEVFYFGKNIHGKFILRVLAHQYQNWTEAREVKNKIEQFLKTNISAVPKTIIPLQCVYDGTTKQLALVYDLKSFQTISELLESKKAPDIKKSLWNLATRLDLQSPSDSINWKYVFADDKGYWWYDPLFQFFQENGFTNNAFDLTHFNVGDTEDWQVFKQLADALSSETHYNFDEGVVKYDFLFLRKLYHAMDSQKNDVQGKNIQSVTKKISRDKRKGDFDYEWFNGSFWEPVSISKATERIERIPLDKNDFNVGFCKELIYLHSISGLKINIRFLSNEVIVRDRNTNSNKPFLPIYDSRGIAIKSGSMVYLADGNRGIVTGVEVDGTVDIKLTPIRFNALLNSKRIK